MVIASVSIGVRPFKVLVSHDGREAYTIDHDTVTVTVVDIRGAVLRVGSSWMLPRGLLCHLDETRVLCRATRQHHQ